MHAGRNGGRKEVADNPLATSESRNPAIAVSFVMQSLLENKRPLRVASLAL